jgi:hypothetical protein
MKFDVIENSRLQYIFEIYIEKLAPERWTARLAGNRAQRSIDWLSEHRPRIHPVATCHRGPSAIAKSSAYWEDVLNPVAIPSAMGHQERAAPSE